MVDFARVLSFLGLGCTIASSLIKGRKMGLILFLLCAGNALVATSYLLDGSQSYTGAASCYIGAVQAFINFFFSRNEKKIPLWLTVVYALSFVIVNVIAFVEIVDVVSLVASLTFVMCVGQKNGAKYRIWTIINMGLWILYDLLKGSSAGLIAHIPFFLFTVAGMLIHDMKNKNKSVEG